ncbi:aminotransferase [Maritimibacter sp. 55A14]|uniref:pyridoxal-phosphate-dependent aminotransferase family protein n=1 Tax=Maritimibacter sp. 55A14 TaxID=2174844 RepID=UPI000D609053|nr:aminotransferase class V-fold PLP-dependent enzyme [Maritimibacter sp. 55A14]PWE28870.1 aminotransferase [Maritimibacter sp. 55A14]
MSLRHGRPYLAIPGPSVMPDRVLAAMHRPAPNIYAGELVETVASLVPDLQAVARTGGKVAMYISNGHGAWEAALANTLRRGDKVLVLATGRFAIGWGEVAAALGAEVEVMDFGNSAPADPARLEDRLRADAGGEIRAVLCTHADTASTVLNDIPALRAAIDAAGHPALFMVDCIASLACDRFEMDAWGVDLMVAASQKGLMTPPGLGFVFFGPRAEAARARAEMASIYWDWRPRTEPEMFYQYFGGTAPTHHIFALRAALTMIHEEGMDAVFARHARLARAVWAACDAWSAAGSLRLNVSDPAHRSHAVTSVALQSPHGTALRDWLEREAGVTLGIGLGMAPPGDPAWHGFFRIAHMGHVNAHMVLGALGTIEAGLCALGLDHGRGALEAAATALVD